MWKKGILTDAIRDKALAMINSGFGLEIWREAGEKTLQKRQKALEEFRELLLSPLPPKKRIKPDVHTEDVYAAGDVLALQFQTKDKPYTSGKTCPIPEGAFEALDGKYFLVQKLVTHKSWHSVIVPEVADHWLIMRLFDGIYDEPPVLTDISALKPITVSKFADGCGFPVFVMESSKVYFKRRKAVLLTNDSTGTDEIPGCMMQEHIFFGVNKPWYNPDSILAASLLRELK